MRCGLTVWTKALTKMLPFDGLDQIIDEGLRFDGSDQINCKGLRFDGMDLIPFLGPTV